jgi:hypothetical protein
LRRTRSRVIEGSHPDIPGYSRPRAVFVPHGSAAAWAARNPVLSTAIGWNEHELRFALQDRKLRVLDHRVVRERTARLALAARAVTAVHEHGPLVQAESHGTAGTASVKRRLRVGHGALPQQAGSSDGSGVAGWRLRRLAVIVLDPRFGSEHLAYAGRR